jgi:hypothetical protein
VVRAAHTVLMRQSRTEMDGQNSGRRAVTNWAKEMKLGCCACACVLACLDWSWTLAESTSLVERRMNEHHHATHAATAPPQLRGCFEFALIRPDLETDLDP